MLVLARRLDQTIVIGDDVVVRVVEIRGDYVRLGVAAPRSVRVDRGEVRAAMAADGSPHKFPEEARFCRPTPFPRGPLPFRGESPAIPGAHAACDEPGGPS